MKMIDTQIICVLSDLKTEADETNHRITNASRREGPIGDVGDGREGDPNDEDGASPPETRTLERAREYITSTIKGCNEGTVESRSLTRDKTAILLRHCNAETTAIIVVGKRSQCELTVHEGALLGVKLGTVLISTDRKAHRYSEAADQIRAEGA